MVPKKNAPEKSILSSVGLLIVSIVALLPILVSAAATTPPSGVPNVAVPVDLNIELMLGKVRDYFFGAVIVTCVFMMLWGAFDITTASGDETKVTGAKKKMMYAAVGLVIAAMSMVIVSLLRSIVGA